MTNRLWILPLCFAAASCAAPTDTDVASSALATRQATSAASDVSTDALIIKAPKPTLVTTACVNASNQLVVTDTWDNQTIDPSQVLTITLSLKRPRTGTEVVAMPVRGPYEPQPTFATITVDPFLGAPWDTFASVGAAASGPFTDTAPALRQPKSGWEACPA